MRRTTAQNFERACYFGDAVAEGSVAATGSAATARMLVKLDYLAGVADSAEVVAAAAVVEQVVDEIVAGAFVSYLWHWTFVA